MHGGFYYINLWSVFEIPCVNLRCVDGENGNSEQNEDPKSKEVEK